MVKEHIKKFEKVISNQKNVSLVFLGVGLSLFLLNISGILSFLPKSYSFTFFDVSVFSSMIIIIYSVYILHNEK